MLTFKQFMVQEGFWDKAKAAVSSAAGAAAGVVRSLQGNTPPRTVPQSTESKPQKVANPMSYNDALAAKKRSLAIDSNIRNVTSRATPSGSNKVDPAALPSALAAAAKRRGEEMKANALPAKKTAGDEGFKTASLQNAAHKIKLQTAKTAADLAKRMPVPRPNPIAPKTTSSDYTIKSGDTLSSLAKAHGTTVADLQRINNIKNPNKIRAGAQLRFK